MMKFDKGWLWVSLMAIGGLVVINYVSIFLEEFYARCIRGGKNLKKRYGKWAIVTGATDGIGYAYCKELGRKGMNVLLISRTESKLKTCVKELSELYPKLEFDYYVQDFSQFGRDSVPDIMKKIEELDVGVLINNVGASYKFARYFHEISDDSVEELITLNVESTTWMTRAVLPKMIKQKRGAIVNISSAAGLTTSPLLAGYGAAKSYIAMFTRALNEEVKDFGVHVQCQSPLFVTTKLAKLRNTSLTVPSPDGYAKYGVAAIGYETICSPYWSHAPYLYLLMNIPESLSAQMTKWFHMGIRKRGMKKEEEQAKTK